LVLSLFFLFLGSTSLGIAQTAQETLARMTRATGWTSVNSPADVRAAGTITTYGPTSQQRESIVISAKRGVVRIDRPDSGGHSVLTRDGGQVSSATDETTDYPRLGAQTEQPWMFGFYTPLVDGATTTKVARYSTGEVNGEKTWRLELLCSPPTKLKDDPQEASLIVVHISPTNGLPVQVEFNRFSTETPSASIPVVWRFSDFRAVGSRMIPFQIDEQIYGNRTISIQLKSVETDLGLTDNDLSSF
jgi:hypothetical protein